MKSKVNERTKLSVSNVKRMAFGQNGRSIRIKLGGQNDTMWTAADRQDRVFYFAGSFILRFDRIILKTYHLYLRFDRIVPKTYYIYLYLKKVIFFPEAILSRFSSSACYLVH